METCDVVIETKENINKNEYTVIIETQHHSLVNAFVDIDAKFVSVQVSIATKFFTWNQISIFRTINRYGINMKIISVKLNG